MNDGKMHTPPFGITVRVYYEDTDTGGIVYYANYLKFCERCRTEFLRQFGVSQEQMLKDGLGFVIRSIKGRYLNSARLDDLLTITCIPTKVKFASLSMYQEVINERNEVLFTFECDIAFLNLAKRKPELIPKDMLRELKNSQPLEPEKYRVAL